MGLGDQEKQDKELNHFRSGVAGLMTGALHAGQISTAGATALFKGVMAAARTSFHGTGWGQAIEIEERLWEDPSMIKSMDGR